MCDAAAVYREAGDRAAPTLLLLEGFPSSSAQCERLIGLLADRYHLVAPDYPGFGRSPALAGETTFDRIAARHVSSRGKTAADLATNA